MPQVHFRSLGSIYRIIIMTVKFKISKDDNTISVIYDVLRCTLCTLSEKFPYISFGADGVCCYCRDPKGNSLSTSAHETVIQEVKQRIAAASDREYDCLVLFSGGKDSSFSLYYIKHVLGLKPLALTIDNGFVANSVFPNMKALTTALGVDHIIAKPARELMHSLYQRSIRQTDNTDSIKYATSACGSCISIVLATGAQEAIQRKIPFLMGGWSPGQLTERPLLPGSFLEEICTSHLSRIKLSSPETQRQLDEYVARASSFPDLYNPLYALNYTENHILHKLSLFGWKRPNNTDSCSSNCILNGLLVIDHLKKYGFHPYEYELAFHVRNGYSTREEALDRITRISVSQHQLHYVATQLDVKMEINQ